MGRFTSRNGGVKCHLLQDSLWALISFALSAQSWSVTLAKYHPITMEEMWDFLVPKGFVSVELPGTTELVFSKRVDKDGLPLSMRVYTGIARGNSRPVGEDAIRVMIFWRDPNQDQIRRIATSKRVHRVLGWKNNLNDRINSMELGPKCECGCPMVKRTSKSHGDFFGCASFPICKQTRSV